MVSKGSKKIPYLRTKNLENHTLFRGTYLYSPYMGVPPRGPGEGCWSFDTCIHLHYKAFQRSCPTYMPIISARFNIVMQMRKGNGGLIKFDCMWSVSRDKARNIKAINMRPEENSPQFSFEGVLYRVTCFLYVRPMYCPFISKASQRGLWILDAEEILDFLWL